MSKLADLKNSTQSCRIARSLRYCGAISMAVLLTACGVYVPDGATVFQVTNSRIEFDRAEIQSADELRKRDIIRLRWYDENTYMTTATLAPGMYTFRTRSYTGGGLSRDVQILPDVNIYEINAGAGAADAANDKSEQAEAAGPTVKGRLIMQSGQRRTSQVSILFIGASIEMRTATVARDGSFEAKFPRNGTWRVEVHVTGNPPLSYAHEPVNVQADVNLGGITLR